MRVRENGLALWGREENKADADVKCNGMCEKQNGCRRGRKTGGRETER